jgi:hypothetical protein
VTTIGLMQRYISSFHFPTAASSLQVAFKKEAQESSLVRSKELVLSCMVCCHLLGSVVRRIDIA